MRMMANHSRTTDLIRTYLSDARSTVESLAIEQIEGVIEEFEQAYEHGRQVLIVGNGGAARPAAEPPKPIEVTVRGEVLAPAASSFTRAEVRQLPGAFGDPFRAIEALPGVTPETNVTRLVGNACAAASVENATAPSNISVFCSFMSSSYSFGSPSCAASQSALRLR